MTLLALDHVRHGRLLVVSAERALGSAVVLLAHGVAVAALLAAAGGGPAWPAVVVLTLAWLAATAPDSAAGTGAFAAYAAWWLLAVPASASAWVLVAALALLVAHAGTAYLAAGPASLVAERAVRLAWLRDLAVVGVATCAGWLTARIAEHAPAAGDGFLAATLLLVALGVGALGRRRPEDDDAPGS